MSDTDPFDDAAESAESAEAAGAAESAESAGAAGAAEGAESAGAAAGGGGAATPPPPPPAAEGGSNPWPWVLGVLAVLVIILLIWSPWSDGDDEDSTTTTEGATETTVAEETTTVPEETTTVPEETTTTAEPPTEMVPVPVTIGALLPQTGGLSVINASLELAVDMAVEEINAAGGDVTVIKADSGTDPNIASAAIDQLLNEGVDAIWGAAGTGQTLSIIDKVSGSQTPQCSPSNTGAALTDYEDDGYYFRTAPSDVLQAPLLANLVVDDGWVDVAVIYRNEEYGAGFDEILEQTLADSGANIVASVAYDPAATSFDAEVAQVAAAAPEAIVLITFAEGAQVVQAMIEAGVGPADVAVYGTDGFKDSVSAEAVDPDDPAVLAGVKGTAPSAAPSSGEATFADRFEAFTPDDTPSIFSAQSYDCIVALVLAAEVAGSVDGIADEMIGVTRDGTACSTYAECHELIAAGEDIDYNGASGPLDFTDVGEPGRGIYNIYQYNAEGGSDTLEEVIAEG